MRILPNMPSRMSRLQTVRLLTSSIAAAVVLTAWPPLDAAAPTTSAREIRTLVPETPTSGDLSGGRVHVYQMRLADRQFVALTIGQRTLVPLIVVRDRAGRTILETDRESTRLHSSPVSGS